MRAKGNYTKAGIKLLTWLKVPPQRREVLWKKVLRGRVANAAAYSPKLKKQPNENDSKTG